MRAGSFSWSLVVLSCHARQRVGAPRRPMTGSGGHPAIADACDEYTGRGALDRPVNPDDDIELDASITHRPNKSKSMLPPLRIRPTRLPRIFGLSCSAAASGAAPAPSARLWVSVQ